MEEQGKPAADQIPLALDYTNPDQLMSIPDQLMGFISEQGPAVGLQVLSAVLVFFVGRWLAGVATNLLRKALAKTDMEDTLERFLCNILYTALLAVVVIATIGQLGVETTSLLAIFGAAGLAIGLALQGSLSNFAAGVLIVAFRPYKVGDFIQAGGEAGNVIEVQIFTTVLKTPDNKKVIVPNAQIMEGTITNFSALGTRRVDLVFGIGYSDNIDAAYKVLQEIIDSDARILKDPAPTIAVNELADSSVNFIVRPWVNVSDYWDVYNHLTEQVKRRFDAAGISIPFPQRDIHVYQHGSAEQ